jgi:hypothetical protein
MTRRTSGPVVELRCVLDAPRERFSGALAEPTRLCRAGDRTGSPRPTLSSTSTWGPVSPHEAATGGRAVPPLRRILRGRPAEPSRLHLPLGGTRSDDRETASSLDTVGDATEVSPWRGELRYRSKAHSAPRWLDGLLGEAARAHALTYRWLPNHTAASPQALSASAAWRAATLGRIADRTSLLRNATFTTSA